MLKITAFLLKKQDFKDNPPQSNEHGSVIIWILVAVALFAALNYAVSSGTRSGGAQITKEKASLAATEIIDYGRILKETVQQLQINGCSDTQISFENSTVATYSNPNAPLDKSCHIFNPSGGGLRYPNIDPNYISSTHGTKGIYINGNNAILNIGTGPLNSIPSIELSFYINGISNEICDAINKSFGIDVKPDNVAAYDPSAYFTGSYVAGGQINAAELDGKTVGCFYSSTSSMDSNVFYQVLIAR